MSNETIRNVRIVYSVEGTDEAARGIDSVAESLSESSDSAQEAGSAFDGMAAKLVEAGNNAAEFRGAVQNVSSGLGMLSSVLGSESDTGAVIGQMARFSAMGLQFGAIFGPAGAVAGGIVGLTTGFASWALSLDDAAESSERVAESTEHVTSSVDALSVSLSTASERMSDFIGSLSSQSRRNQLAELNAQITELTDAMYGSGQPIRQDSVAMSRLRGLMSEADALRSQLDEESRGRAVQERAGGGGGRRRQDPLEALMQGRGRGGDAISWAANLRPMDEEEGPGKKPTGKVDTRSQGEIAAEERLFRLKMQHAEKLDQAKEEFAENEQKRVEEQIQQLDEIGSKIGSTFSGAFQSAISGQEKFDVAMAKGAKSLLLQFGTQMVAEGVGALLTAVGFSTLKPDTAATKAAEGAGKIALGLGLGAAGAAISTGSGSSAGAAQKAPRLGPSQQEQGSGASVVVNLNAPAVVAGTTAQVGREIGRTLSASQARYGRM